MTRNRMKSRHSVRQLNRMTGDIQKRQRQRETFDDAGKHACDQKKLYTTERAAEKGKLAMEKLTGLKFNRYYCRYGCKGWHIGKWRNLDNMNVFEKAGA